MLQRFQPLILKFSKPSWITGVELFVICVLLILGGYMVFTVPLGAGFDEETHLLRVWEMSAFYWIPNEKLGDDMHFPAIYWDFSYRRQAILEPIDPKFWHEYENVPIDGLGFVDAKLTTRSVYSPLLLLPQSLVMYTFGRVLDMPALKVLFAMRFAGLLTYIVLVWLAVRLAPYGKWVLAILVLSPMAIFQASTVSTDAISNGLGFLFIGGCLSVASRSQVKWKEWIALALLLFFLFWAKVNLAFLALLPFVILPPSRFKMKRGYLLLAISALVLALLEVGGWNILAYSRFYTALPGANPTEQVHDILTQPLSFVWVLLSDVGIHGLSYLRGWIADYGYGYWGSPLLTYPLYGFALIAALLVRGDTQPDRRIRLGLTIIFIIAFLATLASLYVSYTPVGSAEIQGVHGRYFTTIMPLLVLALVGLKIKLPDLNARLFLRIAVVLALCSLIVYSTGIYLAYYVRCGTQYYRTGLCYLPVYKNWSPNSVYFPPVSVDYTLTQWFIPKCNGLRQMRVWIDSTSADPNGATEFILNDEQDQLVHVDVVESNSNLPAGGWFYINFPEDWQSGGKWFTLAIQSDQADPAKGVRVSSSIVPEYIDGPLMENGTAIENDMIFQYGCIAGWQKTLHTLKALMP
jgi:uncharacterized membrane protein